MINLAEIITKTNLLLLKNVTFIISSSLPSSLNFETITQPAKALVNSGDLQPPSHPSEEAEWTQKGNYSGSPSPIQFPRELPRLLNEKTFPNLGS
ncbi:hypothetical protein CEXT_404841 [Caerostris extrusa]|uniref:Uncharacterized protein n=1 Tax=Caerostris extrusa TaxID=172846 RepID=A0AAV4NRK3_CAEEX|nr:hypothetical protein CEXT_404841 [Caerostris extrusa]